MIRPPRTLIGVGLALALIPALPLTAQAQTHPLLLSGPMLAYSEMTETAVWVQTTRPAQVQVRFRPKGNLQAPMKATASLATTDTGDHIATIRIPNLPFGTRFEYEVLIDGDVVPRDYPLEFQTQPHWRFRTDPPEFRFALGSCSYINEEAFDRPGNPYGGNLEIYGTIHGLRPDFMLWMGDNVYYREPDWLTESAMRRRWRYDRSFPGLQPLLGSTHHYAVWDDHDYGPNDSDRSFRLRDAALRVFSDYFPALQRGTPEAKGVFHRFEWADIEFFMLDDRYHRSPNRYPAGPEKVMLGGEQMRWLKESLINSNAPFKIIVNGGQMINPMVFFEAFGQFPNEQKELFDFIAESRVQGVLFFSGDRHASELLKVQWPGAAYPWYEFTCSPLSAGSGRNPAEENNPARVPGTWVTGQRNFGIVDVRGKRNERRLILQNYDAAGKLLWRHEIPETELRVPRNETP
jgi:alkaline phosphatase D